MDAFFVLLVFSAGNSPVHGEFPSQRVVTRSLDVFFDLHLNKHWVNIRDAGYLRRHRAPYAVTVMMKYNYNETCKLAENNETLGLANEDDLQAAWCEAYAERQLQNGSPKTGSGVTSQRERSIYHQIVEVEMNIFKIVSQPHLILPRQHNIQTFLVHSFRHNR